VSTTQRSARATWSWHDAFGARVWDFSEQFDLTFEGAWTELFGAQRDELRSVFLADPTLPHTGIVELVQFAGSVHAGPVLLGPMHGFFLLSFERVNPEAQLARLAELGFTDGVRRIRQPTDDGRHVSMAVITAPDGVLVELIGPSA